MNGVSTPIACTKMDQLARMSTSREQIGFGNIARIRCIGSQTSEGFVCKKGFLSSRCAHSAKPLFPGEGAK